MKRFLRLLGIATVLIFLIGGIVIAWFNGHIPRFADTHDVFYGKQLGIEPTTGRVLEYSFGFLNTISYYRLHLSKADFSASFIPKLQRNQKLKHQTGIPIWWNPSLNSTCFVGPGIGYQTENLYIYDESRETLFARCEVN